MMGGSHEDFLTHWRSKVQPSFLLAKTTVRLLPCKPASSIYAKLKLTKTEQGIGWSSSNLHPLLSTRKGKVGVTFSLFAPGRFGLPPNEKAAQYQYPSPHPKRQEGLDTRHASYPRLRIRLPRHGLDQRHMGPTTQHKPGPHYPSSTKRKRREGGREEEPFAHILPVCHLWWYLPVSTATRSSRS